MFKHLILSVATLVLVTTMSAAYSGHDPKLESVLNSRSDEAKARDMYRHPDEVMHLFGIKEGMTVIDSLPGSWYGDIIAPLIGKDGTYIGVRYGEWFFKNRFGDESADRWAKAQSWLTDWPESAKAYGTGENGPATAAYFFPGLPEAMNNTVDAWLLIRSLHHTNRYDPKILDMTAADAFRVLKSGGIVGIVQHRAPEQADDVWADGDNGYLKQSRVISAFKSAGFVLENASEVNANRLDQPGAGDNVCRLLPSSKDSEEAQRIGESDRMTLVFRKP